jgi:hypothetical protein
MTLLPEVTLHAFPCGPQTTQRFGVEMIQCHKFLFRRMGSGGWGRGELKGVLFGETKVGGTSLLKLRLYQYKHTRHIAQNLRSSFSEIFYKFKK